MANEMNPLLSPQYSLEVLRVTTGMVNVPSVSKDNVEMGNKIIADLLTYFKSCSGKLAAEAAGLIV